MLLTSLTVVFNCAGQATGADFSLRTVENRQNLSVASSSSADFRFAAKKVTPGVVHVNATWNKAEDRLDLRELEPLREFFGEEFWQHFFEPFLKQGPVQASASGVIVTTDGYIITNNHVVEGADAIEVVLYDQRCYNAAVVGTDPATDIALLKIDERDLSFIAYGNSDEIEVGEWVLAVGNPFNLASTVTAGIVSAKARNINILKDTEAVESFIQTDAAVNPGNSGGALVNLSGQLIGINTAIATPTGAYSGYSFAIPVNIVKKVAHDLLNFGSVRRGYLGVTMRDMTGSLARQLNIKFTPGIYIDSLVSDGAAFEAGIRPGDIITRIDGLEVETSPQLKEIVAEHGPGEKLTLSVTRNGTEKQFSVTLKAAAERPSPANEARAILDVLGIDVAELDERHKAAYGLPNGLVVTRISGGKISDYTNMKEGFIITRVNENPVSTAEELAKQIRNASGSVVLEGIYPGAGRAEVYGLELQ